MSVDLEAKRVWEALCRKYDTRVQHALRKGKDVHNHIHVRYHQVFTEEGLMEEYPSSKWTPLGERVHLYANDEYDRAYGDG